MANSEEIVAFIRHDELEKAYSSLQNAPDLHKIAKQVHYKYSALATLLDWQDLFYEGITRLIQSVQRGSDPTRNFGGYFYTICRNICQEYLRSGYSVTDEMPVSWVKAVADTTKMHDEKSRAEKLSVFIRQLKPRWALLITLYYLKEPPVQDHQELADALNASREPNEDLVSPGSITVLLYRCRRKLEDIIGKNLYELLEND